MGSGFRTFTAGEVLTASNVQNYLQNQTVMSFADSAARSSAIGTANFEEGMTSYLQDTNLVEVYDGANWASIAPSGPTPGLVQIGTAISFSGVVTQDIPTGTFTSAYQNYRIIYEGTAGAGDLAMRLGDAGVFNATSNNYRWNGQYAIYTGSTITGVNSSTTQTAFLMGNADGFYTSVDLYSPFDSARNTGMTYLHARSDYGFMTGGGAMTVTTSFSQVRFLATGGGNIAGTVYVYGYNK